MYPVEVNYLAALVAAIAVFMLGALWYGPLFEKAWLAAQSVTEEELKAGSHSMGMIFGLNFLGYAVMAVTLGMFVWYLNPPGLAQGLWLGTVLCAGFALPHTLSSVLYSANKFSLFWVNAGYQLVGFLVMASVLTLWR